MTDPDVIPDYSSVPPIYRQRAAKRAWLAIASGAGLAAMSAAVFAFLMLVGEAEDRDGFLMGVLLAFTAMGIWGVSYGVRMLRRNRAG